MHRPLLLAAACLIGLGAAPAVQADHYDSYRSRGHYHYVPGHYDRHRDHYDYHPGHYEYHRGSDRYYSPSRSYYDRGSYDRGYYDRSYYPSSSIRIEYGRSPRYRYCD